jgi:hypothetical protein
MTAKSPEVKRLAVYVHTELSITMMPGIAILERHRKVAGAPPVCITAREGRGGEHGDSSEVHEGAGA